MSTQASLKCVLYYDSLNADSLTDLCWEEPASRFRFQPPISKEYTPFRHHFVSEQLMCGDDYPFRCRDRALSGEREDAGGCP